MLMLNEINVNNRNLIDLKLDRFPLVFPWCIALFCLVAQGDDRKLTQLSSDLTRPRPSPDSITDMPRKDRT